MRNNCLQNARASYCVDYMYQHTRINFDQNRYS